jgi:hypothetical protein
VKKLKNDFLIKNILDCLKPKPILTLTFLFDLIRRNN